ncbi:MAG: hypothetical protein HC859_01220 [Bacteroidia bacterium]|nr:hypothetical protein [Bacteroidia bacterium]
MKRILGLLLLAGMWAACQDAATEKDEFTGNEVVFALQPGSEYNVSGTITFKERIDHTTVALVTVSGTEGALEHPVHLHLGDITAADADVALLLNPVLGSTGRSETTIATLADETPVSYSDLANLNACIKIHLGASGPERDIILAGGNIGTAAANDPSGRLGSFGKCKSE